jgi:uncharacterized protein YjbI with pentapeptide repeats/serine/threonine protein kinase
MGRYKVIRELGRNQEGGRITYLAADTSLDPPQQVVIKEFRFAASGADWSGFKAYEREIEVLRGLNHPRIPRYLDSLETKAGFCLVQEYKNALSLAVRRSFTPEDIKKIAVSVLEILVYLQKRTLPIIHRDIKPENIVVDKQLNAYLVDFGFARIRGQELALSSVAAGTPGFMPPEEQFGRNLTEASDLYSLGATLICLLTGTRSVDVGNLIDDNYRFDFKKLVPKLSPRFILWLEKMVAPNVKHRYANGWDALQALKPIQVVCGASGLESLVSAVKPRMSTTGIGLATLTIFALFIIKMMDFQRENPVKVENSTPLKSENSTPHLSPVGTSQSSLVGYWNFDQCSSAGKPMLADELGSHIEGTMLQGVTCEQGHFGYAGFFDGVDDLIEIPDQPNFHFTNQMTVSAWVKPSRVSGLQTIVNKWYAKDSYMLSIAYHNFEFVVRFSDEKLVKVLAPATPGVWTHVAGVYNGQMLLLYINGQLVASTAASGILEDSDRPISIGNHPAWNAFYGLIDEVRLYNVALNTKQVSELSLSPVTQSSSMTQLSSITQLRKTGHCPQCDLQMVNLEGAGLLGSNLGYANLQGARLKGAQLEYAQLWYANLQDARLDGAQLWSANLTGANLENAQLWGSNLGNANLRNAKLARANLKGALLESAFLQGANLAGANLQGANLKDANLENANLKGANLKEAIMPDGTKHN